MRKKNNLADRFTSNRTPQEETLNPGVSSVKEEQFSEENLEMEELYTKVEMPLVYTLFDMEQAGIRVEAETLKNYGEQLQMRIRELEKEICRDAGVTLL